MSADNTASSAKKSVKPAGKSRSGLYIFGSIVVLLAVVPAFRTLYFSGDTLAVMYPNFLLFTPFREATRDAWNKLVVVDRAVKRQPNHIPTIDAKDYSYESLRVATEDFRYPAVVKGLFLNTPGSEKWGEKGYLSSKIGKYQIPVVQDASYGTLQNQRSVMTFKDAYDEILDDKKSKLYLFFPVKSRFSFNHSELATLEELQEDINKVVLEDLDLDRLWKGFGTKQHKTYYGSQLIMGRGSDDSDETTGTGWHCAAGNNWFVQVIGKKRWYFMDQKYSKYMYPLRGGKVNMMTGNREMSVLQNHIPIRYADIEAGDMLYNPDWEWHTIKNYDGLSVGVPIRELNVSLSLRNNLQYTSIVLLNKFLEKVTTFTGVNVEIGGFPPS